MTAATIHTCFAITPPGLEGLTAGELAPLGITPAARGNAERAGVGASPDSERWFGKGGRDGPSR